MNEIAIVLKADTVTTLWVSEEKKLALAAFKPTLKSYTELQGVERSRAAFRLDIHDSSGEFTTGVLWKIATLQSSDGLRAFTMLLVKAVK